MFLLDVYFILGLYLHVFIMKNILIFFFSKRRRNEKPGKGLRHFAMRVCEKVRSKMLTTYNEVADELVAEYPEGSNAEQVSL